MAGIYESTDGARTIRPIHGSQPLELFLDPDGRAFVYATGSSGGVTRSADRGVGWNSVTLPTGPGFTFITARDVHFDRNNPDIVYISSTAGLFKSTNAGTTFARVEGTVRPTLEQPDIPLVFNLQQGERGSATLPVRMLELNSLAAPFTLATGGEPWLTVTPASGNTPATASVTVDSAGLGAGRLQRSHPDLFLRHRKRDVERPRAPGSESARIRRTAVCNLDYCRQWRIRIGRQRGAGDGDADIPGECNAGSRGESVRGIRDESYRLSCRSFRSADPGGGNGLLRVFRGRRNGHRGATELGNRGSGGQPGPLVHRRPLQ